MKKIILSAIIVIFLVIIFAVLGFVGTYNSLQVADETINSNWAQVENQLKRKNYLLNSCNDRMLKEAFIPVIKTVLTLARAILRLKNYEVPAAHCELLEKLKELSIVDSSVFSKLLDYKEGSLKISRSEVLSLYPDLLVSVGELLKYVNDL